MENLRQLQLMELDILKELLTLFEKNNIRYFALGGTVLGAVRHRGFIPWDVDIDLGMPREDYDRLPEVFRQLPEHLRFRSFDTDPAYPYYFARVEDLRITVRSDRAENDELAPAWIDLFPLDGMPSNGFLRKLHGCHILAARMLFQISRFSTIVDLKKKNRPLGENAMIWLIKTFRLQKLVGWKHAYRVLDRTLTSCPCAGSRFYLNGMGAYKLRETHDKKVFGDGRMYRFEDTEICGPQDFETYLTQLYGDWRTPRDFSHHEVVEITVNHD